MNRLGVRYPLGSDRDAVISLAGNLALPEKDGPPAGKYVVEGAGNIHNADVLAALKAGGWEDTSVTKRFRRNGDTILIVAAPLPPSFEILDRSDGTRLAVRPAAAADRPREKRRMWTGPLPRAPALPPSSLPVTAPANIPPPAAPTSESQPAASITSTSNDRKRTISQRSPSPAAPMGIVQTVVSAISSRLSPPREEPAHVHTWSPPTKRDKAWVCTTCCKKLDNSRLAVLCPCGSSICNSCFKGLSVTRH